MPRPLPHRGSLLNIYTRKPDFTWGEATLPNGLHLLVPDGALGYGDKESVALMAAYVATKHTDGDTGQKVYETVREQQETIDFDKRRREIREERIRARHPMVGMKILRDPVTKEVVGLTALMRFVNPETGDEEYKEVTKSMDSLRAARARLEEV